MLILDINIQLSITLIARNFSRGQKLTMNRDCVDSAGAAASLSASLFEERARARCAGAARVPVYEPLCFITLLPASPST